MRGVGATRRPARHYCDQDDLAGLRDFAQEREALDLELGGLNGLRAEPFEASMTTAIKPMFTKLLQRRGKG